MKKISIVIPTFNEKDHLLKLLQSIQKVNYPEDCFEVVIVSDGSTDGTPDSAKSLFPGTRVIALEQNIGRYEARKMGVNEATYNHILFVDSRTLVHPKILNVINNTDSKAIKGYVECGNPLNPFHVFFESIRYKLYPDFYKKRHLPFPINEENFEKAPKGTGVFYATKEILMAAYKDLSSIKMGKISSDDTQLIRTIINYTEVIHHPDLKIIRFIRESYLENILHLIYRGATFVYYYFTPKKRLFWLVIGLPLLTITCLLFLFASFEVPWGYAIALIMLLDILFALFLGKNISQVLTIIIMIPICVTGFYLGIIRGIFLRFVKHS